MKTKLLILLIAFLPVLFVGCEKKETQLGTQNNQSPEGELKTLGNYCGEPINATLTNWDQTITAGNLIVGNDDTALYVTFEANNDWKFASTYLYVGSADSVPFEIYNDGTGDFAPWAFTYQEWHNGIQLYTFSINLDELDDCFIIVAYSNVEDVNTGEFDIVWGKSNFKSSGYYMDYCLQDCTPQTIECETAFAYGNQYAYCFRDFKKSNGKYRPNAPANKRFKRWGWTNGKLGHGTYDFELWAGAGQCDLSKGTLVGNVVIEYTGCSTTVTYNTLPGYELDETHLYIGNRKIPRKNNGKPTVAPGKYTYKHEGLGGVTTDSYTVDGVYGQKNIIAHAVVCPVIP